MMDIENVKVVPSTDWPPLGEYPSQMQPQGEEWVQQTEAAKTRERIVTEAIENAREGARLIEEAIDWAAILRASHENKSFLVRVHQFVEEMEQTL